MALSFEINPRLLAGFHHESKEKLEAFEDYKEQPLVSIDEACQPLVTILGNELQSYIAVAKANSTTPKNRLTQDESASIYLYTMEWSVTEQSLYAILNETLRSGDKNKLRPWLKYIKLFFMAWYRLPPCEYHTVWHGIPADHSTRFQEGEELTLCSMLSTTSALEVLRSPMYLGRENVLTVLSIETKNGKLIRDHSHLQNDDEILLPPGIILKVTKKINPNENVHIIHLSDIYPSSQSRSVNSSRLSQTKYASSTNSSQYRNPVLEEKIRQTESGGRLDLDSMNLGDRDMEIVANLGIKERNCMILNLRNNTITSVGASILAETFYSDVKLASILFEYNRIGDAGVQYLTAALENAHDRRRTFYLGSNGITDVGCDYIARMLQKNRLIMYLFLNNNQIGDRGARVISEVIRSPEPGIVMMGFSGNKLITDESVDIFCHAIQENPYFHQLFVGDCGLSIAGQERLRLAAAQRGGFILHL